MERSQGDYEGDQGTDPVDGRRSITSGAERLSRRLGGALRATCSRRLGEANFEQRDEPLAEVLGLLATLAEGWEGVRQRRSLRRNRPPTGGIRRRRIRASSPGFAEHAWSF
jgi:hypothetical protein